MEVYNLADLDLEPDPYGDYSDPDEEEYYQNLAEQMWNDMRGEDGGPNAEGVNKEG
jgi:hypothetical protein